MDDWKALYQQKNGLHFTWIENCGKRLEGRMNMTENERLTIDEIIQHCNRTCENTEMLAIARGQNQEDITSKGYWEHYQVANYLEELKQYRAIGTVEGYKRALEISKENFLLGMEYKEKVQEFEAIGTIEEFKHYKHIVHIAELAIGSVEKEKAEIRNMAIDEFTKEIVAEYDNDGCPNVTDYLDYTISIRDLFKIAEKMKGGEVNG